MTEKKPKCPHYKKEMTRLTEVRGNKETVRWICASILCRLDRMIEESERRRAA